MVKMDKLSLIKLAVEEWERGELPLPQAMVNISIVLRIRKPSKECTEWAQRILKVKNELQPRRTA